MNPLSVQSITLGPRDLVSSTPTHHAQLRAASSSLGPPAKHFSMSRLKSCKYIQRLFHCTFRFWKLDFVVIQLLNEASIKQAGSTSHVQVFQVLYVKRGVLIHVKHDAFVKLAELRAG